MPEQAIGALRTRGSSHLFRTGVSDRRNLRQSKLLWAAVAAGVVLIATAWVVLTRMRPSYDAFGWLVWGREVLHWNLNTDGAPSWKPLTFLFTLPYALAGAQAQMWLWIVTSSAGALAGALLAGRLAFRLTGSGGETRRAWAPYA